MAVTKSSQRIRIKLKAYDHEVIDRSAKKIVETIENSGAKVSGPVHMGRPYNTINILFVR